MTIIERNSLVPYTPRQMFELVNNIKEYPRFLPWCSTTNIIEQTETEIEAEIEIAWSGMRKSFTTRNFLYPVERMDMKLVKGPFKSLEGRWRFLPIGEHGCKVHMELEFELTGSLFDRMFQSVFNNIANSLVDAFCKRAVEIYGTR
jgi:ribosome-associated toxin RatA of RatAB toxin-antitoxin module